MSRICKFFHAGNQSILDRIDLHPFLIEHFTVLFNFLLLIAQYHYSITFCDKLFDLEALYVNMANNIHNKLGCLFFTFLFTSIRDFFWSMINPDGIVRKGFF
jgi:hypothetical protein